MKKVLFIIIVLMLFGISSCSKDDSNPSVTNTVVSTVTAGTWKITYFFDTNEVETSNFSGYNFTFVQTIFCQPPMEPILIMAPGAL